MTAPEQTKQNNQSSHPRDGAAIRGTTSQHPAPRTYPPSNIKHQTSSIHHQAISASAGSGKTFRLSHRYIRLLAENIPPDRICALTFSRKAAGEIFDSIVDYLCQAAASSKAAQKTAENININGFTQTEFGQLLRGFLDNLHRMHIGTLDSFMIGIAKTFPAELGIPPEFQVMDNAGAMAIEIRNTILAKIFDPRSSDTESRRQFIEAFRQATFGQEEKSLGRLLNTFIDKSLERYQQVSDANLWGTLSAIGLNKLSWLTTPINPQNAADDLMAAIIAENHSSAIRKQFEMFSKCAAIFDIGTPWPKDLGNTFANRLFEAYPDIVKNHAAIKIGKNEVELSPRVNAATLQLIHHIFRCELSVAITRTKGLFQILDQYEKRYNNYIRQTGQMTFNDAQLLLTKSNTSGNGALISRENNSPEKLYIDYRLDCKLDHWLLDEFQDTSDLQWDVLNNLADEILQDQSGNRTFFYVGDVKQAIYAWRGGNASLFNKILNHYGDSIELLPMNISYRSCPTVIETVNTIFSELSPADGLKPDAVKAWHKVWQQHESASPLKDMLGYTTLIEPAAPKGKNFKSCDRYDVVAAILNDIQPIKRQLDVAVLVSTNKEGAAVVDHLRRSCPKIPVVHEGSATITDNPVVALMLSLLKIASHPGDTLAWKHIQMSPLGEEGRGQRPADQQTSRPRTKNQEPRALSILSSIHTHGFQHTIRHWGNILEKQHPLDQFGKNRLDALIEAAATFDETFNKNIDEFIRFAEKYSIKEISSTNTIRVMTIHQSKGLGFDVVICPELQGKSMVSEGKLELTTACNPETDTPLWVLDMPKRMISTSIPVLDKQVDVIDNDTCYNALCKLYVAITRAKRALYLITSKAGQKSTAQNAAAFIKTRLTNEANPAIGDAITIANYACATLHENGQRNWFETIPEKNAPAAKPKPPEIPHDYNTHESMRSSLERIEPSTQKEVITKAAHVFAPENREVLDFGNAIHGMFEAVKWIHGIDPETIINQWLKTSTYNPEVNRDSCQQFREAIQMQDVRQALTRPAGNVELWREKSFEIVLEEKWVTGQFDRVIIIRDDQGRATSAIILDYKSNRIDQPAEFKKAADHYRPQLELYSQALSHILRIPEPSIKKQLLFTRAGKLIEI